MLTTTMNMNGRLLWTLFYLGAGALAQPGIAIEPEDIGIEVETEVGFRPLNYSIVPTTEPTVRISVSIDSATILEVLLDDTDPATPTMDITDRFIEPTPTTKVLAAAVVPVLIDSNTITVTVSAEGERVSVSSSMLNFNDDTLVVSSNKTFPNSTASVETDLGVEGLEFESEVILLAFNSDVPFETITSAEMNSINGLLREERLIPLDFGIPVNLLRAQITTGEDPLDMARRLTAASIPILTSAMPNVQIEDRAVGEKIPPRLHSTYRSTGGVGCAPGIGVEGCFDYAGPDRTNELRVFRYHFLMDSFPGHRLVDVIVGDHPAHHAGLAVVDRGLGSYAADPCAGAPAFNTVADVACNALFNISSAPWNFNGAGIQVNGAGLPLVKDLTNIQDAPNHHGTRVTAAAAGRGVGTPALLGSTGKGVLGTGKDVEVRPMRMGALAQGVYGIVGAVRDGNVDVINTSWGLTGAAARNAFIAAAVEGVAVNVVTFAQGAGKIWVVAGANDGRDSDTDGDGFGESFPDDFTPRRDGGGTRGANLIMKVCGTGTAGTVAGLNVTEPEHLSFFASFGNHQSVTAPGEDVLLPDRATGVLMPGSGCSFASPAVAGLAAEMIFLDRNVPGRGAASRLTPLQIVEILEATAEDLGCALDPTNPNDPCNPATPMVARPNTSPGNGWDVFFGHGRINVWKALLSVANGGLATDRTTEFPSLDDDSSDGDGARIIEDSETTWYGFKLVTSVKGATAWIDGVQLKETKAILPDPENGAAGALTDEITAYAGVRSDQAVRFGIKGEDPTSGIVAVGNKGGEYIMKFSVKREDLLNGGDINNPKTLSLRRPGDAADKTPFFNLKLKLEKMRQGEIPGVVFDDFVFEVTPPDFGDAPDLSILLLSNYPTSLRNEGARHLNTNLEWFGKFERPNVQSVSPEHDAVPDVRVVDGVVIQGQEFVDPDGTPNVWNQVYDTTIVDESPDLDRYDDGVVFFPLTYWPKNPKGKLEFTVCVADPDSGRYRDDPDRNLYVNAWIDWNMERGWEEGNGEHVIDGVRLDPAARWTIRGKPATAIDRLEISRSGNCARFRAEFPVPATIGDRALWARFRLDYGENLGRNDPLPLFPSDPSLNLTRGAARFGEVEDYRIGADFGDVRDEGGRYPTKASSPGARHLDIYKEWLGDDKSRETNACEEGHLEEDQDRDGAGNTRFNLGRTCGTEDQDGHEESRAVYDAATRSLQVTFTATSTISARGYDLMGQGEDADNRIDEDPLKDGVDEDEDGADGEDGPNLVKVMSLESTFDPATRKFGCAPKEFEVWSTPPWSGGKGRYHATEVDDDRDGSVASDGIDDQDNDGDGLVDEDPELTKPLYANIYVDWNGDRDWTDMGEHVLVDALIAPETFGADGRYTLGEPFEDRNHNGVREAGEDFSAWDSAGINSKTFTCSFEPPAGDAIAPILYVRVRLSYVEKSTSTLDELLQAGIAHSAEDDRAHSRDKGGALFGEVEDDPAIGLPTYTVRWHFSGIASGGQITSTITGPFATCTIFVETSNGESATTVAANLQAAINADSCLRGQGIVATASQGVLSVTGPGITESRIDTTILDDGLLHTFPKVPTLSHGATLLLGLLLMLAMAGVLGKGMARGQ